MRTEGKIEFNMDRNLETVIPKRVSAPVSCHALKQRSDCIHLPHIMFTSSISINTYQLSLYCDPGPEFPPWKTRHWPELTWAVLLRQPHTLSHDAIQGTESVPPLQLAAQSQTSAKADLPAVHTGPMEGPVHTHRVWRLPKGKAFGRPQSPPAGPGPPMLCWQEPGERAWVRHRECQPCHTFLVTCPADLAALILCSFCVSPPHCAGMRSARVMAHSALRKTWNNRDS